MDSRRLSAAFGFALLILCVAGIVYIIHNSGSSRRRLATLAPPIGRQGFDDGTGASWSKHGSINLNNKGGFQNDPNYRSSQPTMQEVSELADELQRMLLTKNGGKKTTAVNGVAKKSPPVTATAAAVDNEKEQNLTMTMTKHLAESKSPKSKNSNKASISAVNYSTVPKTLQLQPHHPRHSAEAEVDVDGDVNVGQVAHGHGLQQLHNDFYTTSWHPSIMPGMGSREKVEQTRHHYQLQDYLAQQDVAENNGRKQMFAPPRSRPPPPHPPHGRLRPQQQPLPPLPPQPPHPARRGGGGRRPNPNSKFLGVEMMETGNDLMDLLAEAAKVVSENDEGDDNQEEEEEEEDDDEEDEDEEEEDLQDPLQPKHISAQLDTLFQLANNFYTSGNESTFQGFLKVINETIERGNNSRLLHQLNELYTKSGKGGGNGLNTGTIRNDLGEMEVSNFNSSGASLSGVYSSLLSKSRNGTNSLVNIQNLKNPYETSLTAFVFMSFGVFLLNQIHSFVQNAAAGRGGGHHGHRHQHKEALNETVLAVGRSLLEGNLAPWLLDSATSEPNGLVQQVTLTKEPSSLDVLFEPPSSPGFENFGGNLTRVPLVPVDLEDTHRHEWKSEGRSATGGDSEASPEAHVNNMFRALLNIVNAYTKDSKAMECIWSLYCRDLDSTAGKHGLYGIAARINSVGLRLIMNQIPPSLTLDVILRSLVGWDGLPCHKMFPECAVGNGTISLVATSGSTTTMNSNSL